jgi:hypothetical protein
MGAGEEEDVTALAVLADYQGDVLTWISIYINSAGPLAMVVLVPTAVVLAVIEKLRRVLDDDQLCDELGSGRAPEPDDYLQQTLAAWAKETRA